MGQTRNFKEKNFKYIELNKNENIICQNSWYTAKAVLRGKYIALNAILDERISLKSKIQGPISKTNKKSNKNKPK